MLLHQFLDKLVIGRILFHFLYRFKHLLRRIGYLDRCCHLYYNYSYSIKAFRCSMKKLASKILGVTSKNYISALVCYNGVDNRLMNIVKEMASKERKLKEFKRRLHLKGELL